MERVQLSAGSQHDGGWGGPCGRRLSACPGPVWVCSAACAQTVWVFPVSLSQGPHGQAGKRILPVFWDEERSGRRMEEAYQEHTTAGRAPVLASGESPPEGRAPLGLGLRLGLASHSLKVYRLLRPPTPTLPALASEGRGLNYNNTASLEIPEERSPLSAFQFGGPGGDPLCHLCPL